MAKPSTREEFIQCVVEFRNYLEKFRDKDRMVLTVFDELSDIKEIDVDVLKETGIGLTVNSFRKREGAVGENARALVSHWKELTSQAIKTGKEIQKNSHEDKNSCLTKQPNTSKPVLADRQGASKAITGPAQYGNERETATSGRDQGSELNGFSFEQALCSVNEAAQSSPSVVHKRDRHKGSKDVAPVSLDRNAYKNDRDTTAEVKPTHRAKEDVSKKASNQAQQPRGQNPTDSKYQSADGVTMPQVSISEQRKRTHGRDYTSESDSSSVGASEPRPTTKTESSSKTQPVSHSPKESKCNSNKASESRSGKVQDHCSKEASEPVPKKVSDTALKTESNSLSQKYCESDSKAVLESKPKTESQSCSKKESESHSKRSESHSKRKLVSNAEQESQSKNYLCLKTTSNSSTKTDSQSKNSADSYKVKADSTNSKVQKQTFHNEGLQPNKKHKKHKSKSSETKERSDGEKNERTHKSESSKPRERPDREENNRKRKSESISAADGVSFDDVLMSSCAVSVKKKMVNSPLPHVAVTIPSALPQAPIPVKELFESLPELSTNYRPLPKVLQGFESRHDSAPGNSSDNLLDDSLRPNVRTAVYSGRKRGEKEMLSLQQLCVRALINNIDEIGHVGAVPFDMFKPVLERCTSTQLYTIEDYNPSFTEDTDELWKIHCGKDFKGKEPDELESWRELYLRLYEEREKKFESLKSKIAASEHKKIEEARKAKVAYSTTSQPKPPRDVLRKQMRYGTGSGTIESTKRAAHMMKTDHSHSSSHSKPAKVLASAPLMMKTKRFMSNLQR